MLLTIELVPRTAWFTNVRSNVSRRDWETCKSFVRQRSGERCEVCGGQGGKWAVECHERWQYNDITRVQTLVDLVALCPDCHEVKHIGLAAQRGRLDAAIEHLSRVNGWHPVESGQYIEQAFQTFDFRSRFPWTLDLSFLATIGVTVPSEGSPRQGLARLR